MNEIFFPEKEKKAYPRIVYKGGRSTLSACRPTPCKRRVRPSRAKKAFAGASGQEFPLLPLLPIPGNSSRSRSVEVVREARRKRACALAAAAVPALHERRTFLSFYLRGSMAYRKRKGREKERGDIQPCPDLSQETGRNLHCGQGARSADKLGHLAFGSEERVAGDGQWLHVQQPTWRSLANGCAATRTATHVMQPGQRLRVIEYTAVPRALRNECYDRVGATSVCTPIYERILCVIPIPLSHQCSKGTRDKGYLTCS